MFCQSQCVTVAGKITAQTYGILVQLKKMTKEKIALCAKIATNLITLLM
jgi:hypothetical protein